MLAPSFIEREGYVLVNWTTKADGSGDSYENGDVLKDPGNLELYAQWRPAEFAVVFDANGGTGSMENQLYVYGEPQALYPNQFTREGYEFKGWDYREDAFELGCETYPDGYDASEIGYYDGQQITVYAQWARCCTLRFEANGGTGTMEEVDFVEKDGTVIPDCGFTHDTLTFAWWVMDPDSTMGYAAGNDATNLSGHADENGVITLYAYWQ